jgi:hypothetical protein
VRGGSAFLYPSGGHDGRLIGAFVPDLDVGKDDRTGEVFDIAGLEKAIADEIGSNVGPMASQPSTPAFVTRQARYSSRSTTLQSFAHAPPAQPNPPSRVRGASGAA